MNLIRIANQETYIAPDIINYYSQLKLLQPAEASIIERFRHQLPTMKMLDIGVGGGRTTRHFSSLVAEYIGIDYSEGMVRTCQQKFSSSAYGKTMSFQVGNAIAMPEFSDNTFDFILFSFNGIDAVDHSDRLKIFQEINRVGKKDSFFFFSCHNLQAVVSEFSPCQKVSLNPIKTYTNLVMMGLLYWLNRPINLQTIAASDYLVIRDEAHNFRLQHYYIRPQFQVQQLHYLFRNVDIYSWKSGRQITDIETSDSAAYSDQWLYYLCQVDKK